MLAASDWSHDCVGCLYNNNYYSRSDATCSWYSFSSSSINGQSNVNKCFDTLNRFNFGNYVGVSVEKTTLSTSTVSFSVTPSSYGGAGLMLEFYNNATSGSTVVFTVTCSTTMSKI